MLDLDQGKDIRRVISIGDPGEPPPHGLNKVERVLRLEFRDEDERSLGYHGPKKEHALKIINFAKQLKAEDYDGLLLIHCHVGVSRSTAAAFICNAVWLGPGKADRALDRVYADNGQAYPNDYLVRLADELLDRDFELEAALRRQPYGQHFQFPGLFKMVR